jgi:hypothetical protein
MASAGTYTAKVTVGPDTGNTHKIDEKSFIVSFTVVDQYPVLVLGGLNGTSKHTFKTAYTGDASKSHTVTVTNTGNVTVTNLTITTEDATPSSVFDISSTGPNSLDPGDSKYFTIATAVPTAVPIDGSTTYSATVLVEGEYGGTAGTPITPVSFNVSYKVNAPFTTAEAALDYLEDDLPTTEGTAANPALLKMGTIAAADTQTVFNDILNGLGTGANKFVELDLSLCGWPTTVSPAPPTAFKLGDTGITSGKNKIVSLILPNTATSVGGAGGSGGSSATKSAYAALKTVSGEGITSINEAAFLYCDVLTEVNFPEAVTIGNSAFWKTALTTASFPEALSIGANAFQECAKLEKVYAFKVTSIGELAFSGCTALTTASFPKVESIEDKAFAATSTSSSVNVDLTIAMDSSPPTLDDSTNIFDGVTVAKNVTIKVVPGASDNYGGEWKTAFKGNSNINLVVEE